MTDGMFIVYLLQRKGLAKLSSWTWYGIAMEFTSISYFSLSNVDTTKQILALQYV